MTKRLLLFVMLFFGTVCAQAQKPTVFVFFAETCPICQYYTPKLRDLQLKFGDEVRWVAVFPNKLSSDTSAINFLLRHDLAMVIRLDPKQVFSRVYGIEVTPEVVVKDAKGHMRYKGRIDDFYIAPGKKRNRATTNELELVLERLVKKQEFNFFATQAVGCLLNTAP
ncbi:MAG: redoxin domain-containing protein [Sphingobacteriaceae bacterium]|nr:redoxin domain-containing protein [Sphingobacteriaceae bacterium]